jgi:hypothetical protein
MSTQIPNRESRQTRRRRERQEAKCPVSSPRQPYLLKCRSEDEQGSGAWIVLGVESPEDGEACARALQSVLGGIPGEPLPRCEVAANTDNGLGQVRR